MRRRGGMIGHKNPMVKSSRGYGFKGPLKFNDKSINPDVFSKMGRAPHLRRDPYAKGVSAPYLGHGRRRGRGFMDFMKKVGEYGLQGAKWVAKNPDKLLGAVDTGLNLANAVSNKVTNVKDTINAIKQQHASKPAQPQMDNMNARPSRGPMKPRPRRPRKAGAVSKNSKYRAITGGYLRGPIP